MLVSDGCLAWVPSKLNNSRNTLGRETGTVIVRDGALPSLSR